MKKLVLSVIASISLAACSTPADNPPAQESAAPAAPAERVIDGPGKPLGSGQVKAFARVDAAGVPLSLGVSMTRTALEGLPQNCKTDKTPESSFWPFCEGAKMNDAMITILDAPAEAASTNVKTMELSWLPFGHAPEKVWDHPQFDIHFNYDSPTGGLDEKALYVNPDPKELPQGYMILPGSGFPWNTPAQKFHSHSADPKESPEFAGGPFTTNFLYINYDGKVIGYEPYVALDFLKAQTSTREIPIKTPEAYPRDGYYPSVMRVGLDTTADAYVIALEQFKQYKATAAH